MTVTNQFDAGSETLSRAENASRAPDVLLAWVDRHRVVLLVVLAAAYIAGVNGQWRLTPDSAAHAVVARAMVESGGAALSPAWPPDAATLRPGLSYLLAANFAIFGSDVFWPIVALMHLFGLAGLGLAFLWVRLQADRPTAVLLTCLLGLNPIYYRQSLYVLTDLPFAVAVLLLLVAYELYRRCSGWRWLCALAMIAVAMVAMASLRSVYLVAAAALVVTGVKELLVGPSRRRAIVLLVLIGLAAGIGRLMDPLHETPLTLNSDEQVAFALLVERLPETLEIALTAPDHLPMMATEGLPEALLGLELPMAAGVVFCLLTLVLTVRLARSQFLGSTIALGFIAQILLTRASLRRYFLPTLPILLLAWWRGLAWAGRSLREPWASGVFWAVAAFWLVMSVGHTGKAIVEQRQAPFYATYSDGKYLGLDHLGLRLLERVPPHSAVVFEHDAATELGWFSRRPVYAAESLAKHSALRASVLGQQQKIYVVTYRSDADSLAVGDQSLVLASSPEPIDWPEREDEKWWLYRVEAVENHSPRHQNTSVRAAARAQIR